MFAFLLLSGLDHFGVVGRLCAQGCSQVTEGPFGWLVLCGGAIVTGALVRAVWKEDEPLFRLISLLAGAGSISLILLMIYGYHSVCQICAGFDVTAIALAFTIRPGNGLRFVTTPLSVALLLLPGIVLTERFGTKSGSVKGSPFVQVYPKESFVTDRMNLVLFADPNCPHCRKLIRRMEGDDGRFYHILHRWVLFEHPIDNGRKIVAIIGALDNIDPSVGSAFLREVCSTDEILSDSQLQSIGSKLGLGDKIADMLKSLPQSGIDRLMQDATAAKNCSVTQVPSAFLVLGEDEQKGLWRLTNYEKFVTKFN
jgi:hypothetical protein